MQPASSQLALTKGVATRSFGSVTVRGTEREAEWPPVPTLGEYASAWLEGISGFVRPQTLEAYRYGSSSM